MKLSRTDVVFLLTRVPLLAAVLYASYLDLSLALGQVQSGAVLQALLLIVTGWLLSETLDGVRERFSEQRETAQQLESIKARIVGPNAEFYDTRSTTYSKTAMVLAKCAPRSDFDRRIYMVSLPTRYDLAARGAVSDPAIELWNKVLDERIHARGRDKWEVKYLRNIVSIEQLERVVGHLSEYESVEDFQVKAFVMPEIVPVIWPLIIGDQEAFLDFAKDDRYRGVDHSIHLTGQEFVVPVKEYFLQLWYHPRAYTLRSASGIDEAGIKMIRDELSRTDTLQSRRLV